MRFPGLVFAPALLALVACGSSSDDTTPPADGGAPADTAATDAPSDDAGSDAVTDEGVDAPTLPPPPGKKLAAGAAQLVGITDDDYVAYYLNETGGASVVPLDGSAAATNLDPTTGAIVRVRKKAVFSWAIDPSGSTLVGAVKMWTKAGGVKALGARGYLGIAQAIGDGAAAIYADGASSDGSTLSLLFVRAGGASSSVANAVKNDADCAPTVIAAGTKLVAAYCTGTATTATVVAVDGATGAITQLATDARTTLSIDDAGDKVLVVSSAGDASIVPIGGGAGTPVDTGVKTGRISHDGSFVVYQTSAGALKKWSSTATTIVGTGVGRIMFARGDLGAVAYASQAGGPLFDLHLVTTAGPATPIDLVSAPTGGVYGDPFTTDGNYFSYYDQIDAQDVGVVSYVPVAGGAPKQLAAKSWTIHALDGARVAYNDGWAENAANGTADIYVGDLSKGDVPVIAVKQADADFLTSPTTKQLVYGWRRDPVQAGVYAMKP